MSYKEMDSRDLMEVFKSMSDEDSDQRACFIIGAGASKQSGIPTGGELALQWWQEMVAKEKTNVGKLEKWLLAAEPEANYDKRQTLHQLWKDKVELKLADVAPFYSIIYHNRFRLNKDEGYEALSRAMLSKQPSYGYSVLANALCKRQHNVVITTNFDNLLEYSLHIFTGSHPLICGHEALASFARHSNNRPLIAKIHRDLFLNPMNEEGELKRLKDAWVEPLKALLADRKVVVLGYGGNDGSLMGLLDEIPLQGRLYWCTYGKSQPQAEVLDMLTKKEGYLVETDGFDELMFLLRDALNIPRIDEEIVKVSNKRADGYRQTEKEILKKSEKSDKPEVKAATQDRLIEAEKAKDEWSYYLRALAIKNLEERLEFLKNGSEQFPKSALLWGGLADCLQFDLQSKDPAIELYYKKAIELDPDEASNYGNYSLFLKNIRKDYNAAEYYFKKTLEFDPNDAGYNGNYAVFLNDCLKDYDSAEFYYKKAIELDPNDVDNTGNYAIFLSNVRKDFDSAEVFFKRAIELDPKNAGLNCNYAMFLNDFRKNSDTAETYFKKAIELDPNNAACKSIYAIFLNDVRKDYDSAEVYYKMAIELDPNNADYKYNYAIFLNDNRKDFDAAEVFYKMALELDPTDASNTRGYAVFLKYIRKDYDSAEFYYKKAIELDPNDENSAGSYAIFLNEIRKDYNSADVYFKMANEHNSNDANQNGNYAQFLLAQNRMEEATLHLNKAFKLSLNDVLLLELWFYRYAHYPEYLKEAKKNLEELLAKGVRSPGWDLIANVERAIQDGHSEPEELKRFAKMIGEED